MYHFNNIDFLWYSIIWKIETKCAVKTKTCDYIIVYNREVIYYVIVHTTPYSTGWNYSVNTNLHYNLKKKKKKYKPKKIAAK